MKKKLSSKQKKKEILSTLLLFLMTLKVFMFPFYRTDKVIMNFKTISVFLINKYTLVHYQIYYIGSTNYLKKSYIN